MSADEESTDSSAAKGSEGPSRAEQLMARPKRREKFTADELEERFDGWMIERRQRIADRTPQENARRRRFTLLAAMGVVGLALVVAFTTGNQSYERASAANAERITELEGQVAVAEMPRNDEARKQALLDLSREVSTKAGEVADAQQGFAALKHAVDTAPSPGGGSPSKEMLAVAEHRKNLAGYFDQDALLVEDEEAYQWSTAVSTEADVIDPRYAWFVRHDRAVASKSEASSWQVLSAMPVVGEEGEAHAVWTCIDTATGEVLAFASADYFADTGKFTSLEVGVTTLGGQHSGTTAGAMVVPNLTGGDDHDHG